MTSKNKIILFIIKEFANHSHIIEDLYWESDSFCCLCKDYYDCIEVLKKIEVSKEMLGKNIDEEYKKLIRELKEELSMRIISKREGTYYHPLVNKRFIGKSRLTRALKFERIYDNKQITCLKGEIE